MKWEALFRFPYQCKHVQNSAMKLPQCNKRSVLHVAFYMSPLDLRLEVSRHQDFSLKSAVGKTSSIHSTRETIASAVVRYQHKPLAHLPRKEKTVGNALVTLQLTNTSYWWCLPQWDSAVLLYIFSCSSSLLIRAHDTMLIKHPSALRYSLPWAPRTFNNLYHRKGRE